jgi:hypothetical protein
MPRLLDIEVSGGRMAIRLVTGIIGAVIAFVVLYFIPTSAASLVSGSVPASFAAGINSLISSLVNPVMPPVGLVIAVLVFLGALLRGTKIYGPIVILLGILYLAYIYLFFGGGNLNVQIPQGIAQGVSGSLVLQVSLLMSLFMIPAILTIVKGVVLSLPRKVAP